ncbi:MAG: epoxyqueuosine reductase QueH [Kiritimatiellae bacterium]|nr:epoxyqueuosine reductase QueH [Kiritimatiellia bacterium]MBQ9344705.1 epoxyqueuosine reductase QueH [Kiritimatiellia bacterium]
MPAASPTGRRRLLLHVCCALCASKALTALRRDEPEVWDITLYWANPNIHPLIEWRRRLKAVRMLADRERLPLLETGTGGDSGYGLTPFARAIGGRENRPDRCGICYALRMDATAQAAKEGGFNAFSTTLFTSPWQDHARLKVAAERAAAATGVPLAYRDWRTEPENRAMTAGLYRQQTCGCVWSEFDRYAPTTLHVWPPPPPRPRPQSQP